MATFSTVSIQDVKQPQEPKKRGRRPKSEEEKQLSIRLSIQGLEYQLLFPHSEEVKARYERELAHWCSQLRGA